MSLKQDLQDDMKTAMRNKDKPRLATIRLVMAAIKQREVDERIELDDAQVLAVLDKMVKQRRESITQYELAKRDDLIAIEQAEVAVLQTYLPEPLSESDIATLIGDTIDTLGAAGMKDMGKVMAVLKPQIQGRADAAAVSAQVKQQLSG